MKRIWLSFWLVSCFILSAATAQAQYPMAKSPWRTSMTINEPWGATTYHIWIDEVGVDTKDTTKIAPWASLQEYCRQAAWRCDPTIWGQEEINRARIWQSDIPLRKFTFIPVNIEVSGKLPETGGPSWRVSAEDILFVLLKDGRELTSVSPVHPAPVHLSRRMPSTYWIETCSIMYRTLSGDTLLTRTELERRALTQHDLYNDHPWANIFLVPMPNQGREFTLRDISLVALRFHGRTIFLQPNFP